MPLIHKVFERLQLGALRDALLDAGAKPEIADRAAEELAGYETRLARIETDLTVLKWMIGFMLALQITTMVKLFIH